MGEGEPTTFVRSPKDRKSIPAKIIIIGNPRVGKTSLVDKFVKNKIESKYLPTVGAKIYKQPVKLLLGKEIVNVALMLWDIAGQKQFKILHKTYYNGARGGILVFDLTTPGSLDAIPTWHAEALNYDLSKIPMILVGNKSDLTEERQVSEDAVKAVQADLHIKDYFETSALTGDRVTEMFYAMAERVYDSMSRK